MISWEQRKAKELFVSTADKGYLDLPVLSATQDRGMIRRDENSINIFHDKKNEVGYKRVLPGQFVIHLRSFQGGFAHSTIEGITSPAYTVFGFSEAEKHDSEYWKYVFTSKSFIQRLETVTYGIRDGRSISYEEFLTLGFVYPSKAEQTAIARYLDKLSDLITLHQKKCLERKKRDFTSASISWEQRKLREIYGLIGNAFVGTATPYYVEQGHFYLESNNVKDGQINHNSEIFINDEFYEKQKDKWLHTGDMVMVQSGHVGHAAVIPEELNNSAAHALIMFRNHSKEVNTDFLNYQYQTTKTRKKIETITTGNTIQHILASDMQEFEVDLSNLEEQKQIANFFRNLDRLITLHQRKLELLKRLRNSLVDRCFIGEKCTMSKLILYHGSPNRVIVPKFGFGEDRHDNGRGFYLTENLELAKEWAVCRPDETNGWVHKYELEMDGLNILDFQKYDVLSWLAELMKHRDAADSRRYKMLAQKFIEKYGIDTCGYDVITGWRANASYFYIAKEFVRDNIDIEILEELLSLGGLGIQFCIKSERAFAQLSEVEQDIMSVDYSEFNDRYNERDINARNKMRALVDSDANKVTHVFSTLFER